MNKAVNGLVVVAVIACGCEPFKASAKANPLPQATVVTPVLDYPIEEGKNVIWCSTFQLAWNELRDVIIGNDIVIRGGPKWVSILNSKPATKDDLSPDASLALVGKATDGITERINEELRRKFPPPVPEIQPVAPNTIVAFAYLRKSLPFKEKFDTCKKPMHFQSGDRAWDVACFGMDFRPYSERRRAMCHQVWSVFYEDDSDFIIMLTTENDEDQIILAKIKPERTLSETMDRVMADFRNADPQRLKFFVPLFIPKVSFDLDRSFLELEGKSLGNPGWESWYVDVARQRTGFELDERGAVLSSEAEIHVKAGRSMNQYVFDRPFLILLRKDFRKPPYFAAWIGNGELLVRQE